MEGICLKIYNNVTLIKLRGLVSVIAELYNKIRLNYVFWYLMFVDKIPKRKYIQAILDFTLQSSIK